MARGYRDRADDSLLTLLGDMPDLVSNLVKAEIDAGKAWVRKTSKDAGMGGLWFVVAVCAIGAFLSFFLKYGELEEQKSESETVAASAH